MNRKRIIRTLCVAAALGALVWLLDRVGWSQIGAGLARVGWRGELLLVLLALAETALDALALRVIVGPMLRVGYAVVVNGAGTLLNLVLPWESGEVLKSGLLQSHVGSEGAISATVIWNYIFKITRPLVSILAALAAWVLCTDTTPSVMRLVLLANALAFLPYLVLRVVIRYGAASGMMKLLGLIPGLRRHPAHWIDLARAVDRNIRQFWAERPEDYGRVFLLQVAARWTGCIGMAICFRLLELPYSLGQVLLVFATMNVAELVISVLPARVGVSEGTAFLVFGFLSLDPSLGLVVYVILRVRTIVANGLLTPFAFATWKPRRAAAPAVSNSPLPVR